MGRGFVAAVVIAAAAVLPGPSLARAARVHVKVEDCGSQGCLSTIYFKARPREVDDITIRPDSFGYRISDSATSIAVGSGCRAVDAHTASCQGGAESLDLLGLFIQLSDRNDRVDARGVTDHVDVRAGRGNDDIVGGAGNDTLHPGAGRDHLDGDGGRNTVDFDQDAQPVHVDLERSTPQGGPGAHAVLRNIQDVEASHSDHDVLRGTPGNDVLSAGRYSLVIGRGGEDGLFARAGSRLVAGSGQTTFNAPPAGSRPRPSTTFVCRSPGDLVNVTSLEDVVRGPCSLIDESIFDLNGFDDLVYRPRPGQAFVKLLWGCFEPPECGATLAARLDRRDGPLVAVRYLRLRRPRDGVDQHQYRFVLTKAAYALLRQRGHLRVVVSEQDAAWRDAQGQVHRTDPVGFTMILRAPGS